MSGLAWTPGKIQVKRYRGLGELGLLELYDRTLPREADRLLRAYNRRCELIDVFQPTNFYVEPTEIGYAVMDDEGTLLGEAASWEEAHDLLPDGAHEQLETMHGIRLDADLRQSLLSKGFYAWGQGIRA